MNLETEITNALEQAAAGAHSQTGAWADVERRVRRSRKRRIIAVTVAGALTISVAVLAISLADLGGKPGPFVTNPPSSVATAPPTLQAKIAVPAFRLAVTKDALWGLVHSPGTGKPGQVVRINPSTGQVVARINVGFVPLSLEADDNGVWVTNESGCGEVAHCGDASQFPQGSVMKIDPRANRVVATVEVAEPQDVEIAFGSVWVSNGAGAYGEAELVRIDDGKISSRIPHSTAGDFTNLAHDDRYLWFLSPSEANLMQVIRLDPRTNGSARLWNVEHTPIIPKIATGFGSIWVTSSGGYGYASGLQRYRPDGSLIRHITLPDAAPVGLEAMTIGEGSVWAGSARGNFWKIDPKTNKPVGEPTLIGDAPPVPVTDLVTGFGSVWVCAGDGKVWRFSP